jgi:hypothetical protein
MSFLKQAIYTGSIVLECRKGWKNDSLRECTLSMPIEAERF